MRPSEFQRKIALVLHYCEQHDIFSKDVIDRNHQNDLLGVTKNTLVNWLGGKNPRDGSFKAASAGIVTCLIQNNPEFNVARPEQFLSDVGVMELGQALGFTRAECRKAIDQRISSVMATFSLFNIDEGSARSTWAELGGQNGGYYIAYRMEDTDICREFTGRPKSVMTIPIALRHCLLGNKDMSKGYLKIRAKAHVFSFRGKSNIYEYDGYITRKDGAGFYHWLFQSRNQTADDVLYLMTGDIERVQSRENDGGGEDHMFLIGTMNSRNQDKVPVSCTWPTVIERVDIDRFKTENAFQLEDWESFDDLDSYFMRTAVGLVDLDELSGVVIDQMRRANDRGTLSPFVV